MLPSRQRHGGGTALTGGALMGEALTSGALMGKLGKSEWTISGSKAWIEIAMGTPKLLLLGFTPASQTQMHTYRSQGLPQHYQETPC